MNQFTYTPTYDDLLHAQLVLNAKIMKRILPWFALVTILLIIYRLADQGFSNPIGLFAEFITYSFILMIAWFVMRKIQIPRIAKKTMRLQKDLSYTIKVRWDNESLSVIGKNGNSTTPFSDYVCWLSDEKVILLFVSQVLFYFYPRHAFPDDNAWESFKAIVVAAGVTNHWPPK